MVRILCIAVLAAGVADAAEVFKWVDSDGTVHFSDRPQAGAERVEIRQPSTFQAPVSATRRSAETEPAAAEPAFSYESLEIVSPAQEEVLWNIEGEMAVSMRLQPRLQPGHSLSLFLDDQPVEGLQPGSTRARLSGVYRGVHVLRAEVADRGGQVLLASQPVTFAVQQTSVLSPNNPSNVTPGPRGPP
jgi:hypothetical protein